MWKDEPQAARGPAHTAHTAQGAPLAGVRVLDLTRLLPGPMCTLHLADLGADVIKIEDLGLGDYAAAGVREQVNRNKRGLRIDLKHPEGVATLLRLCERADVLVESFRPGVMDRLGVGWAAARARITSKDSTSDSCNGQWLTRWASPVAHPPSPPGPWPTCWAAPCRR